MLAFDGRPMVELALEKLRSFCAEVSVAGNRKDLRALASVVEEVRSGWGPGAGLEAGLQVSLEAWALFLPVDAPLVPAEVLQRWTAEVIRGTGEGMRVSFLRADGRPQPTFCLLHTECLLLLTQILEEGERKLAVIFDRIAAGFGSRSLWVADAEAFAPEAAETSVDVTTWFSNVNTPEDLKALELRVRRSSALE